MLSIGDKIQITRRIDILESMGYPMGTYATIVDIEDGGYIVESDTARTGAWVYARDLKKVDRSYDSSDVEVDIKVESRAITPEDKQKLEHVKMVKGTHLDYFQNRDCVYLVKTDELNMLVEYDSATKKHNTVYLDNEDLKKLKELL